MPDFTLGDILSAYGGGVPDPENPSSGQITPATVLLALNRAGRGVAQADVAITQGIKNALMAPGDIAAGRFATVPATPGVLSDEDVARAQLNEAEANRRAYDLATIAVGAPGGGGGAGSGVRAPLSFSERMAEAQDVAFQRAQKGTATGDYGLGTARRTAPDAPAGSMEAASDRLMSSLRDTQRQLRDYKTPPQNPLLAPGETASDLATFFSGGNKKAGALLAAEKTLAGDQYVLPGAERASDATMAQRAADAPLKPTVPQKPMDVGLFGEPDTQGTLFSGGNERAAKLIAAGQGIRAYHGSPYDFEKFDLSKIGTGEGAQAYGHGLYFAENPNTAKTYRDSLSDLKDRFIENTDLHLPSWVANSLEAGRNPQELLADFRGRVAQMTEEAKTAHDPWNYPGKIEGLQNVVNAIEAHAQGAKIAPAGRMYEVNINAKPEQFLDWDKPISQQSEAVQQLFAPPGETKPYLPQGNEAPGSFHFTTKPEFSQKALDAGIPGIRYLDQGSRGAPFTGNWRMTAPDQKAGIPGHWEEVKPTSNYVVFNPEIVDILKKYGLAGLTMGGVLQAASQPDQRQ